MILGATGVFTEIQGSINYIWSIRAKPKKGWLKFITNRLISFSLVISCGFILLVSLVINAIMELLNEKLQLYFKSVTIVVFYILNWALIFAVITALFAIIFKVLPDATIRWRDATIGAAFTALLFMLGKFLISLYIGKSNVGLTLRRCRFYYSYLGMGVLFFPHPVFWGRVHEDILHTPRRPA